MRGGWSRRLAVSGLFVAVCTISAAAVPAVAAPGEGDEPPQKVGVNLGGDPVLIEKGSGRATVVSFWATWCPYCLKELPILYNIQRLAGKERMQVVAVNVEARDVFRRASRLLAPLDIEFAYDPDHRARDAYGVNGIPHMVVIGRDGKIVAVFRGYGEGQLDAITAAINLAISQPSSQAPGATQ